jgi:N,N'-diacetyllegionaminate synthase
MPPSSFPATFGLGKRTVGPGHSCLIVAEVAQAHDGSLGTAHAYIDAAARAGADAIKFQTHIAEAESSPAEPWRVRFSTQDASRYDYWKRMEFPEEKWFELREHADKVGLIFLSSPFSAEAVELLDRVGVPAWKFGAGEITSTDLLRQAAATGKPVLLSSGMSRWEELDAAVEIARAAGAPCAVYQCTSAYPCPPEQTGLNVLAELRQRYGCPVGLSDHSGQIFAGLAAASLGANLLEVHITFSKEAFGPDVPASLTLPELRELVRGVRWIESALAHPVDKAAMAEQLQPLRKLFQKSAVAARDLRAGSVLTAGDFVFRKPGGGLGPDAARALIGQMLRQDVARFSPLSMEAFVPCDS